MPFAASRAQVADPTSAADLNRRSAELYRQGRYAESIALLREAYRRTPEPVIQYNLARACEMLEDYACAITAYETYLATRPADRKAIEARLVHCRERLAAERARPKTPPRPPERPPPRSLLPPVVAAVGVVGLGVGLAMASAAGSRHDDAVRDPTQSGAQATQDSAAALMRSANITMIAGGSLAAAGVIWWIVDIATHRAPKRTALQVGPGTIGVRVAF